MALGAGWQAHSARNGSSQTGQVENGGIGIVMKHPHLFYACSYGNADAAVALSCNAGPLPRFGFGRA